MCLSIGFLKDNITLTTLYSLIKIYLNAGGGVDAEVAENDQLVIRDKVSGVEFGTLKFAEVIEKRLHNRIGRRTDRKCNQDFTEMKMSFFEVRSLIFDCKNRLQNSWRDKVNFVGNFIE